MRSLVRSILFEDVKENALHWKLYLLDKLMKTDAYEFSDILIELLDKEKNVRLRRKIVKVLGRTSSYDSKHKIEKIIEDETEDISVREEAKKALEKVKMMIKGREEYEILCLEGRSRIEEEEMAYAEFVEDMLIEP